VLSFATILKKRFVLTDVSQRRIWARCFNWYDKTISECRNTM